MKINMTMCGKTTGSGFEEALLEYITFYGLTLEARALFANEFSDLRMDERQWAMKRLKELRLTRMSARAGE